MKVITLLNEKGGVGKTTLAKHLAWGLACRGWRTMLVDGDPQGHATIGCGLAKAPGLYDLLVRDKGWQEVALPLKPERYGIPGERIPQGKLYVLPSNVETRNIASSIDDSDKFVGRLDELKHLMDFVVVDTSPTPSLLHGMFYNATSGIIYPTQLAHESFDGLMESIQHRQAADKARFDRWGRPAIEVLGIIPTMYRSNTSEQKDNLKKLQAAFGETVWSEIPLATIWAESGSHGLPVYTMQPGSAAARMVWSMVERVERAYSVKQAV